MCIVRRYSSVIALLHSGDPCSSCGLRFLSSAGDLYRLHLNWHYKINREEKEGQGKTSRNWFLHPDVSCTHCSYPNRGYILSLQLD